MSNIDAAARNWDSENKSKIRPELMRVKRSKKTAAKKALFLPSYSCLCIQEALKNGAIDKKTELVCIERDKKIAIMIRIKLMAMGFTNFRCINKSVEDCGFSVLGGKPFDYVYLDTCNTLNAQMQKWIEYFCKNHITYKTVLLFTFMYADRSQALPDIPMNTIYVFSNRPESDMKSTLVVDTIKRLIPYDFIVSYGRAYKESGKASQMVSFRLQFGWRETVTSGSKKTYDLGYNR